MKDEGVKVKVTAALERAKDRRMKLLREIQRLEGELSQEDHMITCCLEILVEMQERGKEDDGKK